MKVEIIGVKVVSVAKDGTFTFPTATTQSGTAMNSPSDCGILQVRKKPLTW